MTHHDETTKRRQTMNKHETKTTFKRKPFQTKVGSPRRHRSWLNGLYTAPLPPWGNLSFRLVCFRLKIPSIRTICFVGEHVRCTNIAGLHRRTINAVLNLLKIHQSLGRGATNDLRLFGIIQNVVGLSGRALKTSMGTPGELLEKLWGSGVPESLEAMISLHLS